MPARVALKTILSSRTVHNDERGVHLLSLEARRDRAGLSGRGRAPRGGQGEAVRPLAGAGTGDPARAASEAPGPGVCSRCCFA